MMTKIRKFDLKGIRIFFNRNRSTRKILFIKNFIYKNNSSQLFRKKSKSKSQNECPFWINILP